MYKTTQVQNTISITQPLETISIAQLFQFQGRTKDKKHYDQHREKTNQQK
jgi:F0F1-type ATP synthase gamma subunit